MLVFEKMLKQKTEQEFGTAFIKSKAIAHLGNSSGYFMRELETMHGRPDVVLFDAQPESDIAIRRAIYHSPSTNAFATVFLAFKSTRRSLDEYNLALITGLSFRYIYQVMRALVGENLVIELKNGKYKLHPKATIPHTTITSIEFKLHDWKKAIKQSIRHRAFADKAYVIMPINKTALLKEKRDLFAKFGISVGVFDMDTGRFEAIYEVKEDKLSELSYIDVMGRYWLNQKQATLIPAL